MRCAECGSENREGARFCVQCGAAQTLSCPQCSHANPPGSRFCEECGASLQIPEPRFASPQDYTPQHLREKILASRGEMEGERKHVTVLFADFSGFTPMSSGLDPEEVHRVTNRWFDLMLEEVHLHEGTVTQFRGDGIMALFGAPITHEDHALRAVRAALGIQRSIQADYEHLRMGGGEPMQLRIGLNSGPVVVGNIGTDLSMTYTALGDTVNIADRIQSVCTIGSVAIGDNTRRLVEGLFVFEDMGAKQLKGITEPVPVYEVRRPVRWRSRIDLYAEKGLTPFVGRERQLQTLLDRYEKAKAGKGQMVFISGEPGIGKSRLLYEFKKRLEGEDLAWLEGRCISYGKEMSYLPVIDTLKDSFDIQEGDTEPEIIEKVETRVRAIGGELAAGLPYIKLLLSVDPGDPDVLTMDPQLRKANIFQTVRALGIGGSRIRPVVTSIEDLHWMDRLSEEWVSYISETVSQQRILMLLTYRTDYDFPFGERPYYTHIHLGNLSDNESAEMAEGMLAANGLPPELQQIIASKAEGNPFFVEEVIKSLLEEGAIRRSGSGYTLARPGESIDVPDTVEGVIMARLDRLEQEAKRAIQTAAVIGREFTVRLLERTAEMSGELEEYLKDLKSLELIYERSLYPELAYMFKHALTHDVAYNSLLGVRRRALHHMVGTAVEDLYSDRLTEHSEMLAHHYERAEVWEKALDYLVKAGEKATAAHANQDALGYYARALEVCDRLGAPVLETAASVARDRALVNLLIGDIPAGMTDLERMLASARSLGDRGREGMALAYLGLFEIESHEFEKAEETLRTALDIASEVGDDELTFVSHVGLAEDLTLTNRHAEAETFKKEAERLAGAAADPIARGLWAVFHGTSANWVGQFDEAVERAQLARQSNPDQILMMSLFNDWCEALAMGGRGDYDSALRLLHEIVPTCERIGEMQVRARALNTIGWIYCELQDHATAMKWNQRSVEIAIKANRPDPEFENNAYLNLGDSLMALGRLDEAEEHFQKVEQVARNPRPHDRWMLWRYSQHLFHSYGELWLVRGDYSRAISYADECLSLAEESDSKKNIVKGRRLRGQALLAQGKQAEAERELATALQIAQEIGNPPQLWKTHAAIGHLQRSQGRDDEAREAYRGALAVIERVAADLEDGALRETFLSSEHVQSVRRAAEGG